MGCGKYETEEGLWICPVCLEGIEIDASPPKPLADLSLDGFVGVGFYHDPILRKFIRELKYHGATALLPSFGRILRRFAEQRIEPWPWANTTDLIIQPLPGVPKRVRARGFDQSVLLAELIRETWAPWADVTSILKRRTKSVSAQADLEPGPLREANVKGSFEAVAHAPRSVVLVDDVVTTGATMAEAARLLRSAGHGPIYGISIAVGK